MFGRAFELTDGTVVLPCEFCGSPVFEPDAHTCPGLMDALTAEAERRELDTL